MRLRIDDALVEVERIGRDTVQLIITDRYDEIDIRMTREEASWLGTCLQAEAAKVLLGEEE
jgi:hypothetical protein